MINAVKGLGSIDVVLHVGVGELHRPTSSSLTFSHMIYCRFRSMDDYQVYCAHPAHMRVLTENVEPIVDDGVLFDWISNGLNESPKPGSAVRVTLLKLKDGLVENEKNKLVMEVIMEGIKNQSKGMNQQQISFGENLSQHIRTKGYSIGIITVFPGPADLEASNSAADLVKEKAKDSIESELVADYVFPPPKVANH
uniref:stress-response A/B barrel domain-containing protein UP3-like n=1 Tax=Erigeron canadensis TaxID=72917 RepID=UPI001CB93FD6|nr:stress-response A/B barrel domain-containing protein UP3-like [Erigeron canadensis]